MIPLRQKIASFLTDSARKGIEMLDSECACAKTLEKIDVENSLREDINRICQAASFTEITRVLTLVTRLRMASREKKEAIKSEFKKIAEEVVARVEKESGKLKMPQTCRHLLLEL